MPQFTIVMPAYNESDKIIPTITQVFNFMRKFTSSFEFILVDDGSTDQTADLVQKYTEEYRELRLIRNKHLGKGPAIWTGVKAAKGDFIYLADADLSTPIDELKKLYNWMLEHNYDIVIASREGVGAERVNEPLYRHLMGRVFNMFVQFIALKGINDSQCGFKLFRKTTAKDVFKRLKIYNADSANSTKIPYLGAFDVEVLYVAKKLGYKIKEVPVLWTYVKTTRLNPVRDSIRMAIDVIKIRLNDIRGLYKN